MSDEITDVDQQPDPVKNLKEEFNRKFQNIQAANEQLARQNQEYAQTLNSILDKLNSSSQTQRDAGQEELDQLKYTDPDKYLQIKEQQIERRLESKVTQTLTQRDREVAAKQAAITELVSEYPELNQAGSAFAKKVQELHAKIDQSFRDTPAGYRLAVSEAAIELGMRPMSKRTNDQLDEMLGSGSHRGSDSPRPPKRKDNALDPKTVEVAKLFGIDPKKDKERMERIAKFAKRDNWMKYRGDKDYDRD